MAGRCKGQWGGIVRPNRRQRSTRSQQPILDLFPWMLRNKRCAVSSLNATPRLASKRCQGLRSRGNTFHTGNIE
ncbi:hypothetical protein ANTQUA_LOCUS7158 [Anthophora quadrimaculata]